MRATGWPVCPRVVVIVTMLAVGLVASMWWLVTSAYYQPTRSTPPHIIIMLADDLGWNDVSFHGSDQFQTPNIDALAYSGVILKDYYTQPICTPTRAALLTGRHPIHNGMEHDVLYSPEPWGLPLSERILPQYLNSLGYVSRAVGKWHLGFFHSTYTPTRRGFDSHYGIWLGEQNYYNHTAFQPHPGYDFRRNMDVVRNITGKYSEDLFTEEAENIIQEHNTGRPLLLYMAHVAPHAPLEAPEDLVQNFSYIPDKNRQIFAAMVTKLDESVGRVMAALSRKNMLHNSIILFMSDNGGATHGFNGNVASNFPFRGGKDTLWEGGVRSAGLIWSPLLKATPRVHRGLVNVQDLLPTLLDAAGAVADLRHLDGVSQWPALQQRSLPPYNIMLHNIDPVRKIGALRDGDWKIIYGRTYNGKYDGFYGQLTGKVPYDLEKIRQSEAGRAVSNSPSTLPTDSEILQLREDVTASCTPSKSIPVAAHPHVVQVRHAIFNVGDNVAASTTNAPVSSTTPNPYECQPQLSPCLFNLRDDPCETRNLASEFPLKVEHLLAILNGYRLTPANNKPEDPTSYPEHWNNTWVNWRDFLDSGYYN